jgi:hypothetical protein
MKRILLTAILASCYLALDAQVPTLNLELEYRFSNNADDTGPNNLDGTNVGATLVPDRFGNPNAAYDFSSAGYIDCNNILNTTIAGTGKQMTISFWVKPSAANANNIILAKHSDAGCGLNQREFFIRALNDMVNVEYYGDNAGTMGRFVCGNTLMTNTSKWYNVVVTYDGNINTNNGLDRVGIFVDSVAETTTLSCRSQAGSFPFDIATGIAHFGVGNYLTGSGTPCLSSTKYKGKIDDIRIYSRILTSIEIGQLFNETTTGLNDYENTIGMEVYPNPASDQVSIKLDGQNGASAVSIVNVLGEVVYSAGMEQELTLQTSRFSKGIYFVNVISENGSQANKKIVIR